MNYFKIFASIPFKKFILDWIHLLTTKETFIYLVTGGLFGYLFTLIIFSLDEVIK